MSENPGSLARHAAVAACLVLVCASFTFAQSAPQPVAVPAPSGPEILSRGDFLLSAVGLANDDNRFNWDANFGGSVDLVDYVVGRFGLVADYEVLIGNQLRAIDPNQGNYTLELFTTARIGPHTEVGLVLHHVSRHLSDRAKVTSDDWNLLGVRLMHHVDVSGTAVDLDLEASKNVRASFVDYSWNGELRAQALRSVSPHLAVYGRGSLDWWGVHTETFGRGRQVGAMGEVGVRLKGRLAQMELYAGVERRVDAYPLELVPKTWGLAGFRLLSR